MVGRKQKAVKKKVSQKIIRPTRKLAQFTHPMLAKEADKAFDDKDWIFEIKWDGYRAIADLTKKDPSLYSRNGNDFAFTFPIIAEALKELSVNAILDGEIVVLNKEGFPDFQKIQHYGQHPDFPLYYYVFDLLSLDGHSLIEVPLLERKKLLKILLGKNDQLRFSDHIEGNGKDFFEAAMKKNLEGVMAKKADSLYYPGKRTNEWLKIKLHKTTEAIIVGYTKPTGSRKYFGSLVLAIKNGKEFKHVGQAGTGFDTKLLSEIFSLLQPVKQSKSIFTEKINVKETVTWVKPVFICEVKFTEWTIDGKLRHPAFLRLRDDKFVKEVNIKNSKTVKITINKKEESEIRIGRKIVKITNREKLYWPKEKITKGMLIDYYQSIATYILPFLKDRPQSLKRNPDGIKDAGFYHKDAGENVPDFVKTFKVRSESTGKDIDYIVCNDKATLAYLNNLGCIELNPWHSTIKETNNPDYIIIDIDPSDKNSFEQVIEVANCFKKVLDKAGAKCYCKTSGATGIHIYIPAGKKYDYGEVKEFAQLLCMIVSDELPEFTTLERNLKKRGDRKIYLDYLQNRRSQTISSVYSVRPRKAATVSMPLQWKEVKKGLKPDDFTIHNALKRIKKSPDIFKPVLGSGINIQSCLVKLQNSFGEIIPR